MPSDGQDIGPKDEELVRRAQVGDRPAFGMLVARYQDRVYNVVLRLCHDRADAADLTQSTFLRALGAVGNFEARAGVYTWLYRIAVNVTISHLRLRSRKTQSLDQPDRTGRSREWAAPEGASVEESIDRAEELERLRAAIARVDEEFRAAVVLRDVEGLDYAEISRVLEVPVGTVKSRIHRGRAILRELLTGEKPKRGNEDAEL